MSCYKLINLLVNTLGHDIDRVDLGDGTNIEGDGSFGVDTWGNVGVDT